MHAPLRKCSTVFPWFLILATAALPAQTINPRLLESPWSAHWIRHPEASAREFGVFHFRKAFELAAKPQRFVVHASADNRYELFVNGERVATGPARGDLNHWRFETLDLAPHLLTGRNVLAAVVWNYAGAAPMAQVSFETGFVLQGDTDAEAAVNTNKSWRVYQNPAIEIIPIDPVGILAYFVSGPEEVVRGENYPWGWEQTDFDDSSWLPAAELPRAAPRCAQDAHSRWMLVPRRIPLLEEHRERFGRVARSSGLTPQGGFLEGRAPLIFPPHTKASLLLDRAHLTCAYPEVVTSGGRGSKITLTYAEALRKGGPRGEKGNRNDIEGKEIVGFSDHFYPDGGRQRIFRPLWWRTYRYVQVDIETREDPLTLEDVRGIFTAYPFGLRARFASEQPELERIWEVGWRTLRLSAHEIFTDSPYYEQLQYVGDTRIESLISIYTSGDARLMMNAIELIGQSRTPDGLTQSRYPSHLPQFIPPFSLIWVGMLHDLWCYRGEEDFLREHLDGMRGVLSWFEQRLAPTGLLGRLEWWNFVDWTPEWRSGVPPQLTNGQSAILSLQFAAALREAADLEEAIGVPGHAARYRELAKRIAGAVHTLTWDSGRGLLADTPRRNTYSQHTNIFGVLTDAVPASEQKAVMEKVLADANLTQASFYFRFYLFRAMKKASLADRYIEQLKPWQTMLDLGLTTWAETPEPTRSDCHAWSAHPNLDLLATVAGIRPAAAGFRKVLIEPHLGPLIRLEASMPHPMGEISVRYTRDGEKLDAVITLPEKLSGTFRWGGKEVPLRGGTQKLSLP